jgi:hypothetical protein
MVRIHSESEISRRYVGWDLLKLASFIAIIIFHYQWVVWYTLDVPAFILDRWAGAMLRIPTEFYARCLSFSGFTIVFMAGLNQGQTGKKLFFRKYLFLFLVSGWLFFSFLIFGVKGFYLAWDVYPLLFLGLFSAHLIQGKNAVYRRIFGVVGFLMLFVPFWELESKLNLSFELQHILVGNCKEDYADWPILPWIGLVWFGFCCGGELRALRARGERFVKLQRKEGVCWFLALVVSINYFGPFYNIDLGKGYACAAFRFDWYIFWAHFIWPLFIFRISIDQSVQEKLLKSRVVNWLVSLSMVRNFWLAYIIHFAYIHLLGYIIGHFDMVNNHSEFNTMLVLYATLIPIIELLSRLAEKWVALVAKRYQ